MEFIRTSSLLIVCIFCWGICSPLTAQQDLPYDLFNTPIDNMQVYRHFEKTAVAMSKNQRPDAVAMFQKHLQQAPASCDKTLRSLSFDRPRRGQLYEHMVKSNLYIGELYNCGRCEKTHAGFAGGVVISKDGLALTNHHVLESRKTGKTEGIYAMTWDGQCFGIKEILFASEKDDVALVQLDSGDHVFHAAPIARKAPNPMDPIRIVSHPYGEFFVMTHGEVSRYAAMRKARGKKGRGTWMEVTAPYGSGSSGSGVFNEDGEVVGVVSSIRPLFRNNSGKSGGDNEESKKGNGRYVEMLVRKCVPLSAILNGFRN